MANPFAPQAAAAAPVTPAAPVPQAEPPAASAPPPQAEAVAPAPVAAEAAVIPNVPDGYASTLGNTRELAVAISTDETQPSSVRRKALTLIGSVDGLTSHFGKVQLRAARASLGSS